MRNYKFLLITATAILIGSSFVSLAGQVGGSNLFEYQYGNIPDTDPSDLNTLYNQTNLTYRHKKVKVSVQLQQFYNSQNPDRNYLNLAQYHLKYKDKKIRLDVGTIYETLGRGLVFRTYEIKNSILEDQIYRVREGFHRDLQGVSFAYKGKVGQIKIIGGRPLNNIYPPGDTLRRTDFITGTESYLKFKQQKAGIILLRNDNTTEQAVYGSFFLDGNLFKNLSYYGEYASILDKKNKQSVGQDNEGHTFYAGLNYSFTRAGVSLEYKDYKNFFLGSGFSAPPTLVKEHTYRVLNRSTHISEPVNEKGIQAEVFYMLKSGDLITLNYAETITNQFKRKEFREVFAEYSLSRYKTFKAKVFVDYSMDDLYLEKNRYAAGVYLDKNFGDNTISLNSELQTMEREFVETGIWNSFNGLTFNYKSKLMVSAFWEFSTDPNIADRKGTTEIEDKRHFLGGQIFYRMNEKNSLSLFAGQRRGGPACSSGICYTVLDFEGVELRINTRF